MQCMLLCHSSQMPQFAALAVTSKGANHRVAQAINHNQPWTDSSACALINSELLLGGACPNRKGPNFPWGRWPVTRKEHGIFHGVGPLSPPAPACPPVPGRRPWGDKTGQLSRDGRLGCLASSGNPHAEGSQGGSPLRVTDIQSSELPSFPGLFPSSSCWTRLHRLVLPPPKPTIVARWHLRKGLALRRHLLFSRHSFFFTRIFFLDIRTILFCVKLHGIVTIPPPTAYSYHYLFITPQGC